MIDIRWSPDLQFQGQTIGYHGENNGVFQEKRIIDMEYSDLNVDDAQSLNVKLVVKEYRYILNLNKGKF